MEKLNKFKISFTFILIFIINVVIFLLLLDSVKSLGLLNGTMLGMKSNNLLLTIVLIINFLVLVVLGYDSGKREEPKRSVVTEFQFGILSIPTKKVMENVYDELSTIKSVKASNIDFEYDDEGYIVSITYTQDSTQEINYSDVVRLTTDKINDLFVYNYGYKDELRILVSYEDEEKDYAESIDIPESLQKEADKHAQKNKEKDQKEESVVSNSTEHKREDDSEDGGVEVEKETLELIKEESDLSEELEKIKEETSKHAKELDEDEKKEK